MDTLGTLLHQSQDLILDLALLALALAILARGEERRLRRLEILLLCVLIYVSLKGTLPPSGLLELLKSIV